MAASRSTLGSWSQQMAQEGGGRTPLSLLQGLLQRRLLSRPLPGLMERRGQDGAVATGEAAGHAAGLEREAEGAPGALIGTVVINIISINQLKFHK